jgi:hypothetical protein
MAEVAEQPVTQTETPASSVDDAKVVDAIQSHLDAFNIESGETPVVEAPVAEPVEEKVEAPTEEKPVEAAPEKPVETPVADTTLPAAYVRTAKARGWTDQEVIDFTKANPDIALKTFERMHESRTQEIQEWAELGRKVRQNAPSTPASAPVAAPQVQPATGLQPLDVNKLAEQFGQRELIEAIAGPINAQIAALKPLMDSATAAQKQADTARQENLGKLVQDFFTDKTMTPFATVYGKDIAGLTKEQVELRGKVLETADALIAGAAYQGRQLSTQDALALAHDSISSGFKENIIRDQLRTTLTKRQNALTLKPTAQGRKVQGGPPKDRAELVGRTEDRLAKAFG